ncbi:hypothetical protein SNE510_49140 [Streptomyces sp. NE5-10]|uniref:hypothetical protein n=1 Tax=Streptomyces sp. NE5-10 TaxID=2759674 RepID=UPI001907A0E5|nr:hypothetical protein [Streptomyces sp. NE5-10]GHJ95395.1 hypothetical protein SNE510_49140 [Streptomyces sp. NE5-10]
MGVLGGLEHAGHQTPGGGRHQQARHEEGAVLGALLAEVAAPADPEEVFALTLARLLDSFTPPGPPGERVTPA